MTAALTKDVLYPGRVYPPDLKGESVEFTAEDMPGGWDSASRTVSIPFLARRAKEMLAAGFSVPVARQHQDAAVPMTEEERDRLRAEREWHTVGWAESADLAPEGFLQMGLALPDEADRNQLKKSRFVSPELRWNIRTGDGRLWPGPSITHVAVTSRPVQHLQKPFRLSLDQCAPDPDPRGWVLRLALDDYEEPPMAKEEEGKGEGGEGKGKGEMKELLADLESLGIPLPSDTTRENLAERLCVAAKVAKHHMGEEEEEEETEPGTGSVEGGAETPPPVAEVPPEPSPVGLSLEGGPRLRPGDARILKRDRADLEKRVAALLKTGRCDKPTHDLLAGELKAVRLSLAASGEPVAYAVPKQGKPVRSNLIDRVAWHEALPAGACFAPAVRLSMEQGEYREVADPEDPGAGPDPEVMARLTGGRYKAPAK